MNSRFTLVFRRVFFTFFCLSFAGCFLPAQGQNARVTGVALLGNENGLQLKISASAPVATDSQVLSGPDRIVIDFPGALPGNQLRGFAVKQAGVRAVRVGLFGANPPITRVVVDLERPIQYQLVPSGNSVLVKLGSAPSVSTSSLVPVSAKGGLRLRGATVTPPPAVPAQPPLQVTFNRDQLWVSARKATLAEVLYQIHLRTGADIAIPAGAEQEQVAITVGPGPAKDVVAALLNGSRFNFILVGSAQNPNDLRSVVLTPKTDIGYQPAVTTQPAAAPPPQPEPEVEIPSEIPSNGPPPPQPDAQPQPPQPVSGRPEAEPGPETPVPNQGQGQTIPPPTTPPPPPTQDQNGPWTEPPPTTPQPD